MEKMTELDSSKTCLKIPICLFVKYLLNLCFVSDTTLGVDHIDVSKVDGVLLADISLGETS